MQPISTPDVKHHHRSLANCVLLLAAAIVLSACSAAKETKKGTPEKLISVVPSATETLFALGLADRVIGVGDYDQFPPEAQKKPRMGGLVNPSVEKIIAMHPDLVVTYGTQEILEDRLRSIGIRMFPFVHGNVEQTLQFILDLGREVGVEDRAKQLVQQIRTTFDEVHARAPRVPPKVLLVHSRDAGRLGAFYSVGSKAFQNDLIQIAGGTNLFADVDSETIQPALEEVISRSPDIVVETLAAPLKDDDVAQRKKDWQRLASLHGKIFVLGESSLLVPGPRLGTAAQKLGEVIQSAQ